MKQVCVDQQDDGTLESSCHTTMKGNLKNTHDQPEQSH